MDTISTDAPINPLRHRMQQHERGASASTVNGAASALRFFYPCIGTAVDHSSSKV